MSVPADFLKSLQPGDLVAATVASSAKLHLVTIVRPVTADMCKGEPSEGALQQMFDARVLCSARPRFWWRPTDQMETWQAENKCWHCFAEHRRRGYPAIRGWAKKEAPEAVSVRLPWGWHEVATVGHPLDLPADAPDPDPDEDERKVGSKRQEVRRWLRGGRYVRLTHDADKRFCVRYGAIDDEQTYESWTLKAGWDAALLRAMTLMALGGVPVSQTRYDKLTMDAVSTIRK